MDVIAEGRDYVAFDVDGFELFEALPADSLDAVFIDTTGQLFAGATLMHAAVVIEPKLKPGGLIFAMPAQQTESSWGWVRSLSAMDFDEYSSETVAIYAKPPSKRFLFHALTCTEEQCDDCIFSYLATLKPKEIADHLFPYVATQGVVAMPWFSDPDVIRSAQHSHLYSITARGR